MPNQSEVKIVTTFTKEQIKFLTSHALIHRDTFTYYHLPQWFADLGKGEFEILTFDQLPDYVREDLKDTIPNEIIHY